jgi:CIC family chloride channel protein
MRTFDAAHTDDLAVVDDAGAVVGVITDAHVRRRYAEELDKAHRELFGEG